MERDRLRSSKAVAAPVEVLEHGEMDDLIAWAPAVRNLFIQITPSRITGCLLQRVQRSPRSPAVPAIRRRSAHRGCRLSANQCNISKTDLGEPAIRFHSGVLYLQLVDDHNVGQRARAQ
jgi:hypothetical protein